MLEIEGRVCTFAAETTLHIASQPEPFSYWYVALLPAYPGDVFEDRVACLKRRPASVTAANRTHHVTHTTMSPDLCWQERDSKHR
jgi:hypothetical protein